MIEIGGREVGSRVDLRDCDANFFVHSGKLIMLVSTRLTIFSDRHTNPS